jgi:hypothetical protein
MTERAVSPSRQQVGMYESHNSSFCNSCLLNSFYYICGYYIRLRCPFVDLKIDSTTWNNSVSLLGSIPIFSCYLLTFPNDYLCLLYFFRRTRPPANCIDSWLEVHTTIRRNELPILPALEEDTQGRDDVNQQNRLHIQDEAHVPLRRLAHVDLAAGNGGEPAPNERLQQHEQEDLQGNGFRLNIALCNY